MNATLEKLLGGGVAGTVATFTSNSPALYVVAVVWLLPVVAASVRSLTITVLGGWMAICGSRRKEAQLGRAITTLNRPQDPPDLTTRP